MNTRRIPASATLFVAMALASSAASAAEFANVISKTAITQQVSVPAQSCQTQMVPVSPARSIGGAIVGGVAGGLLGGTVGSGSGKGVAAAAGAIAGAIVGDRLDNPSGPVATQAMQICQNITQYENRVVGYEVVYEYNGQQYTTRMDRDPGNRIAISVVPEGGAAMLPPSAPSTVTYPQSTVIYPAPVVYPAYPPYPPYGPNLVIRPYFGSYYGHDRGYGYGYGHHRW
jgi:uncharacterized protein YcfJ